MSASQLLAPLVGLMLLSWLAIALHYRQKLLALWLEPVMTEPVLIIESDDWGPGPVEHADSLRRIIDVLLAHRDATARPAIMTIGAVLAVPDTVAIRAAGYASYRRRMLSDPEFLPIKQTLLQGRERGVLAIQLHGMEHCWPGTLLELAREAGEVRNWLETSSGFDTESLPSAVQSRWTDVSALPSCPLGETAIRDAVAEETQAFSQCFGEQASVVVPPTFVWSRTVERHWANSGVRVIVTPGKRLTLRDANGKPGGEDKTILNGDRSEDGMIYLVRDVYFEPSLGHDAKRALDDAESRFSLGRPALLETHRFNFVGDPAVRDSSLAELDRLLMLARDRYPGLRFMNSCELAEAMSTRDPGLVSNVFSHRLAIWLRRAARIDRLRKLAWMTGLALPVSALQLILSRFAHKAIPSR